MIKKFINPFVFELQPLGFHLPSIAKCNFPKIEIYDCYFTNLYMLIVNM